MLTDSYLLRLAWLQYRADKLLDESPIKAWRKHGQLILASWRGLMRSILPPSSWEMLKELLDKYVQVRQLWIAEGGWLITKTGGRRKRWSKNLRKPNPRTMKGEIDRARGYYMESLSDGQHTDVEVIVLAASGSIMSAADIGCATSRIEAVRRTRYMFPTRLKYDPGGSKARSLWDRSFRTRTRALVRKGILEKPPFSRKLR